ncbi:formylglycine-generating enzyme family protein [Sinorhizobium meliloti]|uniref:formylglycine-generating enzyme family protein n=1 Tax=Rhizobium meliloti TaxID=382 RepID=UPI0013E37DEB|nr:SUMF1/EgtB/PvdO family nonheme iron enzyme [Sinorhizobium meliloti]
MSAAATNEEVVNVPGGVFDMGSTLREIDETEAEWSHKLISPDYIPVFRSWLLKEYPAHQVSVDAFALMKYPVTNAQYRTFLDSCSSRAPESVTESLPPDHPVWGVSLRDATGYASWLSERTGQPWRLPTEAEWEWSARGRIGRRYPFGERFDVTKCNSVESGKNTTTSVYAFANAASPFGICDLAGNVEEWTSTSYAPYPGGNFIEDDLWNILGQGYPILRGGSFLLGGDLTRTRRRHGPHPELKFRVTGFRLARNLSP